MGSLEVRLRGGGEGWGRGGEGRGGGREGGEGRGEGMGDEGGQEEKGTLLHVHYHVTIMIFFL